MSLKEEGIEHCDDVKNSDIEVIEIKKKKPNISFSTEMMPRSKLFGKTQSFLKELEKSNKDLTQKINKMGVESVSIENFDPLKNKNKPSPYIDMDLYLGVLEKKNDKLQQKKIQSTTDKLLGINQKKSIVIQENDNSVNTNNNNNNNDSSDDDQDIDL